MNGYDMNKMDEWLRCEPKDEWLRYEQNDEWLRYEHKKKNGHKMQVFTKLYTSEFCGLSHRLIGARVQLRSPSRLFGE